MVTTLLTERKRGYVVDGITFINVTHNFGGFRQQHIEVG